MVSAQYDQITGIATVSVRAFTPEDAHLIATSMVDLSEDLVNRLQGRMLKDGLKTSEAEVTKAEERLAAVQKKIAQFRKEYGVIDPNASIVASNAGLAQTLRATLSQQQLSLDVIVAQTSNPNAPVVQNLKSQIKAIRDQIAAIENSVTTDSNVSGGRSVASAAALSTIVGQYEPLDVERQLAIASLASSKQALDMARASAAAQHLYLTPFVQPNIPQSSIYPKRILSVVFCSFIAFVVWILLFLVARSIREHFR
jgi:capsular polysaccharide transport system permease protein